MLYYIHFQKLNMEREMLVSVNQFEIYKQKFAVKVEGNTWVKVFCPETDFRLFLSSVRRNRTEKNDRCFMIFLFTTPFLSGMLVFRKFDEGCSKNLMI